MKNRLILIHYIITSRFWFLLGRPFDKIAEWSKELGDRMHNEGNARRMDAEVYKERL